MPTTPTAITSARSLRPQPTAAATLRRHSELESSLEAHFNRVVRLHLGGRAVKMAATEKGQPDRLVLLPGGRMFLVELKTTTGRTSAAQDLWHERAAGLGTRVQVLVGRAGIDKWVREKAQEIDEAPPVRPRPRKYHSQQPLD
jgi:hypothetical protein